MDKTIGILGGGQLGRMMAQAALPLNIQCIFLEDQADCPASQLGQVFPQNTIQDFAQQADVFTLEFENTSVESTDYLTQNKAMFPPRLALATAQNRLLEKSLFQQLDIPVAPFCGVESLDELKQAVEQLGLPIVVKTAMGGYDGKGQFVVKDKTQIDEAWRVLSYAKTLIAESFVNFSREVSIIAVRGQNGEVKTWSLAENHHHHGILSHSIVPAPQSDDLQPIAQDYITRLLNHLDYVGVLTLELFVTSDGLYANEIAPRVHNSGHWTIEGAVCSQFENHIRAVTGLPLGCTDTIRPNVMVNIIGEYPDKAKILALDCVHLHLYNKEEREGRKIGHLTIIPNQAEDRSNLCQQLATLLPQPLALTVDMKI